MVLDPDRRTLIAGLVASGFSAGCVDRSLGRRAGGPGIAITVDDFDLTDTALLSGEDRDTAIRAALRRHRVKAAGFVAGKYVDDELAPRVLRRWSEDGHIIGNHSFSHQYFGGQKPDALMDDILRCEQLLSGTPTYRKLFRFPYLAEGRTAEGRDAMRALLARNGYRNAPVTIDTSDWYVDNRLKARLQAKPGSPIDGYRKFYLDHLWDRATFYDGLATSVLGRSIDHTILLHHRLTTALFLDDALSMFRARGWRLVDAEATFDTPALRMQPATLPAGQSVIWAAAKADGRFDRLLRYPGEDGDYEAPRMDALGL